MSNVKKTVEDLARAAKIAASGQKPFCECGTCNEVVKAAEDFILALAEAACPAYAHAVASNALSRIRTVRMNSLGGIVPVLIEEVEHMDKCEGVGMTPSEFVAATYEASTRKPTPKADPI